MDSYTYVDEDGSRVLVKSGEYQNQKYLEVHVGPDEGDERYIQEVWIPDDKIEEFAIAVATIGARVLGEPASEAADTV